MHPDLKDKWSALQFQRFVMIKHTYTTLVVKKIGTSNNPSQYKKYAIEYGRVVEK
jgi:hypothetical protein